MDQYTDPAEYYSTAFHEATHSTGHPSRLHRFEVSGKIAAFGSEDYSKEELTAEIGAACILHQLGISSPESLRNSAAYVQNWLQALKNDKQMIIGAAARAEKAVRLILNQPEITQGEEA
jgi:antirestriction protein ArdC